MHKHFKLLVTSLFSVSLFVSPLSFADVGKNTLTNAIDEHKLKDVESIGKLLKAGTNCGSCRPELNALIKQARV